MIVPKFSEVFVGKKYFTTLTQETDLSVMADELTIKYNNIIIVKDGYPRPKQLAKVKDKPVNTILMISRLTKRAVRNTIPESEYFAILWALLNEPND